jgi:hypothetical protein
MAYVCMYLDFQVIPIIILFNTHLHLYFIFYGFIFRVCSNIFLYYFSDSVKQGGNYLLEDAK